MLGINSIQHHSIHKSVEEEILKIQKNTKMFSKIVIFAVFAVTFSSCYPYMDLDDVYQQENERNQGIYEEDEPVLVRERRQLFGGLSKSPQGPRFDTHQIGYRAGPAWGSMSQSGGPITYSGGLGHTSPEGHGLSGSLSHTPGLGGQGSLRGTVGLLNTPDHHVSAFAQHDISFDRNMRRLGPETNSAGINYQHSSGANAFLSGSKTAGLPSTGTVGGAVPFNVGKDATLSVSGQTTFGHGMEPEHQVGVIFEKTF